MLYLVELLWVLLLKLCLVLILSYSKRARGDFISKGKIYPKIFNRTNVRTLHSLAFRRLGIKKENVMQKRHYEDLGKKIDFPVDYMEYDDEEGGIFTTKSDDCILFNSLGLSAANISARREPTLKNIRENIILLVVLAFI